MSLTDTKVRRTKPGKNDRWLADGNGLYLRVTPGGNRTWWFRQSRKGQRIQDRIGSLDEFTLVQARAKAGTLSASALGTRTVEDLADRWYRDCILPDYRRPEQVKRYLDRTIVPTLGPKALRKLTRAEIVDMLADYRARGTVAANHVRRITRQMLAYGVELGWIETNPGDGISKRVCGPEATAGERVLTDDELRRVWNIGGAHQRLFRVLLLTGIWIGEARLARWSDVRDKRLHIPVEHSKNRRPHWVHLPPLAVAELGEHGKPGALILNEVSATAVQAWLRRYCEREKIPPFTPHDLRRTFATRLNELGIAPHIVEKCLNHSLQGVMATYNRADHELERVNAAEIWAAEIGRLLGKKQAKVVRMRAKK